MSRQRGWRRSARSARPRPMTRASRSRWPKSAPATRQGSAPASRTRPTAPSAARTSTRCTSRRGGSGRGARSSAARARGRASWAGASPRGALTRSGAISPRAESGGSMGRIVLAGAMSHVLDPDYYERVCGAAGRRKTEETMAAIAAMGERLSATRPDALIVVADDHLNAFSFNCVPAMCVRTGREVQRMRQDHAEAFDAVLEHMPTTYPLHEGLANAILEQGTVAGFDLALSWEAPVDHAFLAPVNTLHGTRPIPPLVPIWINCFVAPQPTARRCFAFGRHIARVVAGNDWNVGIIATGGLSHFPELSVARIGQTDSVFDNRLIHWMQRGEHEPLQELSADELHKTGSHEFLNWMVLLGAVSPARADVRYFGELPRINLAAVEWRLP